MVRPLPGGKSKSTANSELPPARVSKTSERSETPEEDLPSTLPPSPTQQKVTQASFPPTQPRCQFCTDAGCQWCTTASTPTQAVSQPSQHPAITPTVPFQAQAPGDNNDVELLPEANGDDTVTRSTLYDLLKQFEDVLVYLKSIKAYFSSDDDFNWNYGKFNVVNYTSLDSGL